jgi:putative heme-binding domain-containing protein
LLQLSDFGSLRESFTSLLKVDQPIEIQLAALDVLCSFGDPRTASILLLRRSQLSQQMQHAIRMRLMSRSQWTVQLLEDSQANQFAAGELQILSKSSNKEIKRLADQLLKQATSPSKDALIRNYQKSLSLLGTALEGKKIFEKHCANCHRASGIGFEIGPNLAAMKSRGKAAILSNVLDPNREVNPSFNSYIVQLDDGRNVNGMITNETSNSITLTSANNKAQTVSRDQIEAIKNSGLSLMPEGLEKDISVEQMADLLEFLMSSN